MHDKFSDAGLVIIGVSDEAEQKLADHIEAKGIRYPVVRAPGAMGEYGGRFYPSYFTTHLLLGEGYLAVKDYGNAEVHLLEAVGINPFDPAAHTGLAQLYQATQRPELAQRASEDARKVGGAPGH